MLVGYVEGKGKTNLCHLRYPERGLLLFVVVGRVM